MCVLRPRATSFGAAAATHPAAPAAAPDGASSGEHLGLIGRGAGHGRRHSAAGGVSGKQDQARGDSPAGGSARRQLALKQR